MGGVSPGRLVGHMILAASIAAVWYLAFPVEVTYPSDVLVEGLYLVLIGAIAFYIQSLDNRLLSLGWTVFFYARYVDWLDEFFVEANPLVNPYFQGLVTFVGLAVTTVGVARSMERRDRRVERLRAVNEELTETNERLDRFAGTLSHDIRSPLNVVRGRVNLARETGELEHLAEATAAVDRVDRMVDDVLTLVDGDPVDETAPVELAGVATAAWEGVAGDGAELRVTTDATVEADRARLRQLFENLFRNAVEHAGESPTVTVGADETAFYVTDDGPGIPPADRDAVFEWGASNDGGTGFGLAIVEELASAHGWDVSVGSGDDGGTRFEFATVSLDRTETPPVAEAGHD